jgi:Uma2 family endonuclease
VFAEPIKFRCNGELFYPDVLVTCETYVPGREWFEAPVLLAEVLSPSTHRRDRELKWSRYQHVPNLQTYLLVAQHRPWVHAFRRTADGWTETLFDDLDAAFAVDHPACRVALRDVYRRVPMALG